MPRIAFLVAFDGQPTNDNGERLPRAFAAAGWDVVRIEHGSLEITAELETAQLGTDDISGTAAESGTDDISELAESGTDGFPGIGTEFGTDDNQAHSGTDADGAQSAEFGTDAIGARHVLFGTDENGDRHDLRSFDRFWLIGFGEQPTFLDRMQFLRALDQQRFVNSIDALTYVHGKPRLLLGPLGRHHPETVVGGAATLLASLARGGRWIGKPIAGSFGRDVFVLSIDDPNHRVIVEHLTRAGYAMLQRQVDIRHEKRALIAGGRLIGLYGKLPDDHRGNVAAGSQPTLANATQAESVLIDECIAALLPLGVSFATLDLAFPYLLDVNVANPGWLQTYEQLSGRDLASEVVAALS